MVVLSYPTVYTAMHMRILRYPIRFSIQYHLPIALAFGRGAAAKPSRGFPLQYHLFIALAFERRTVARLYRHDQAHRFTVRRLGRVDSHFVSYFERESGLTTYREYPPRTSTPKPIFQRNRLLLLLLLLLFLTFSALVASPKKTTLHDGQSHSWSAKREKKEEKKVWQRAPPPPPPPARAARSEKKNNKKITRRIHMSRRYASRRHAGGLGPSRVHTRIPTTRRLGQWVSLRKILRFRMRLQLSQSRCLSLLLAMSGRVFLFFPPRAHEPPPTLRDRLNPNLSL